MNRAARPRRVLAAVLVAPLLLVASACSSEEDPVENLVIEDVWAPPTGAGEDVEVRFVVRSPAGDSIDAAEVPATIAAGVSFRGIDGGAIDAIELPDDSTIVVGPDSFGIVLEELVDPLAAGDRFELTLAFADAGDQFVPVVVGDGPPFN